MKKAAILGMAAFYLLLTTGVYGCFLHCTVEYLVTQLGSNQYNSPADHDNGDDAKDNDCKSGDCTCCYHHGTYVVNENIRSGIDFRAFIVQPTLIKFSQKHSFSTPEISKTAISWPKSTGPPFLSGQPIYISNRTLLI